MTIHCKISSVRHSSAFCAGGWETGLYERKPISAVLALPHDKIASPDAANFFSRRAPDHPLRAGPSRTEYGAAPADHSNRKSGKNLRHCARRSNTLQRTESGGPAGRELGHRRPIRRGQEHAAAYSGRAGCAYGWLGYLRLGECDPAFTATRPQPFAIARSATSGNFITCCRSLRRWKTSLCRCWRAG